MSWPLMSRGPSAPSKRSVTTPVVEGHENDIVEERVADLDADVGNPHPGLTDRLFGMLMEGMEVELPSMSLYERVVADYDTVGLSLEKHPLELLLPTLKRLGGDDSGGLKQVLSLVDSVLISQQRQQMKKGICFISLDDEARIANRVILLDVYKACRKHIHGVLGCGSLPEQA